MLEFSWSMQRNPFLSYAIVWGAVTIGLILLLSLGCGAPWFIGWLVALTIVTFLAFRYDQRIAGSKHTRVPELVLLGLTFIGGTFGAFFGMWYPFGEPHKTRKTSFLLKIFVAVILQIVSVAIYFFQFA